VFERARHRVASTQGATMVELLVVVATLGILAAIAVPAYLSFRSSAQNEAARANVQAAIPAAESYYVANGSSYAGLTGSVLRSRARGIDAGVKAGATARGAGYCLEDTQGTHTWSYVGGGSGASTAMTGGCGRSYAVR